MASALEELRNDIKELEGLLAQATRPKVQGILSVELRKLQTEYINKEEKLKKENDSKTSGSTETATAQPTVPAVKKGYSKEITTYGWDQSDKFMKIYITVNGVHKLDKSQVTSQFNERSFRVDVSGLENINYYTAVSRLTEDISPENSYHKIKTDMILVMMKKVTEKKTWPYVTEREGAKAKDKSKPKMGANEDPNDGLMTMMKQMYEDGDDEMKRTIAKAWTESRDKNPGMM